MARLTRTTPLGRILALAIVCALGAVVHSSSAEAQGNDKLSRAKGHYTQGVAFYNAGDYRSAINEFSAADRLAPSPLLDYNMGLCHERLGETGEALRRYRSYRVRAPNAQNRAEVDAKIAKLEAQGGGAPVPPDPTTADPNTTDPNATDPNATDPNATDPNTTDPNTADPNAADPNTGAPTYPATGDPALDRVASIDLNEVAARHPGVMAPAAPPAPEVGGSGAGQPVAGGTTAPVGPPDKPDDKPKPLYKRWWFWVVVGVSALILIDIASSDSNQNNARVQGILLDPSLASPTTGGTGGFTIRF